MKNETVVMKSELIDLAKAREFITMLAQGAGADGSAVTKIKISSNGWNAVISEHALRDGVWKRFTIECKNNNRKFMTIYLQRRAIDIFRLLGFTKFFKRAMDIDGAMVLIKGETQEVAMAEEIENSDSMAFPFIFQCPQCGRKFKTSIPQVKVF